MSAVAFRTKAWGAWGERASIEHPPRYRRQKYPVLEMLGLVAVFHVSSPVEDGVTAMARLTLIPTDR